MLLKYVGPKPRKQLDPRWGKEYLFALPSMTCEVEEEHGKALLSECRDLFQKVEKPDPETKTETVIEAPGSEPSKVEPVRFFKRGRPRKNAP